MRYIVYFAIYTLVSANLIASAAIVHAAEAMTDDEINKLSTILARLYTLTYEYDNDLDVNGESNAVTVQYDPESERLIATLSGALSSSGSDEFYRDVFVYSFETQRYGDQIFYFYAGTSDPSYTFGPTGYTYGPTGSISGVEETIRLYDSDFSLLRSTRENESPRPTEDEDSPRPTEDEEEPDASTPRDTLPEPGEDRQRSVVREGSFNNPIAGVGSLKDLLLAIVNALLILAVPVVGFFFVYAGFLYVIARGNPEGLTKARVALTWAAVGTVIIFGAFAIVTIIENIAGAFR